MSQSAFNILLEMFYDAKPAFAAIRLKSRVWLPLIAITLGTTALYYWYYQTVDFSWLMDHMLAATPDLTADQREATRAMMTPAMVQWSALGASLIITPLMFAIFALYYLIAGNFMGSEIKYDKWFAFCVWTGVPRLLTYPLMAWQIVHSKGQVALEDLSMVSLNALFLHLPNSDSWASFASGIDLTVIWQCVLAVIGLAVWTGRGLGACIVITLLPLALIYGAWAAKIAFA
jgi:hypothetical protein